MRDDLYFLGLNESRNISEQYNNESSTPTYLQGVDNRQFDVWAPLLIIAEIIGAPEVMQAAKNYMAVDAYLHKIEDTEESEMIPVLRTLQGLLSAVSPTKRKGSLYRYKNDAVFEYFRSTDEFRSLESVNMLTRILGKIGIVSKSRNVGKKAAQRCYDIDSNSVQELGLRYATNEIVE